MATEHAMATMERAANDRIDAALGQIADRFQIAIPAKTDERLSARMSGIRLLERHADVLESIVGAGEPADLPADVAVEIERDGTPVVVTEAATPKKAPSR